MSDKTHEFNLGRPTFSERWLRLIDRTKLLVEWRRAGEACRTYVLSSRHCIASWNDVPSDSIIGHLGACIRWKQIHYCTVLCIACNEGLQRYCSFRWSLVYALCLRWFSVREKYCIEQDCLSSYRDVVHVVATLTHAACCEQGRCLV
jgi:hypothetical protein